MDDITFCMNGWHECSVIRCERHPHNIQDKTIPHSYAELYQTEYCPLGKSETRKREMVKIVRCNDCRHWDETDIHSTVESHCRRCRSFVNLYTYPTFYCAYGVRKDG